MLIDWIRASAASVPPRLDRDALAAFRTIKTERPFGVPDILLLALRWSALFARVQKVGRAHSGPRGGPLRRIESIPPLDPAARSRLLSKGQALFDHCLGQKSKVCTTGFVDYELSKRPAPLEAMLLFVAQMTERRIEAAAAGADAAESLPDIDVMIDECVALVYGFDLEAAEDLVIVVRSR